MPDGKLYEPILKIKAECTQLGLSVEASRDGGETWHVVQLTAYKNRVSPTVMGYKTCIDPATDREEYLATIKARGVIFEVVHA